MDLSGEICQGNEMERYLYPMDGTLERITTEKSISSITIVRKQRGLTRGTGEFSITLRGPTSNPQIPKMFLVLIVLYFVWLPMKGLV